MNTEKIIYQVNEWDANFEGAKSRTYSNKSSCQMPTKHGLGYRRLIRHKDGPALFGAWCAMIQVLSRHPKKREGYCTDTGRIDGKPYTSTDLELLTDIPAKIFDQLFQVAASENVGWLRIPQGYHADTTGNHGTIYSDSDLDSNSNPDSNPKVAGPPSDPPIPEKSKTSKTTWMTPYAEAWEAAYGGEMACKKEAPALRAMEKKHGPEKTLKAWKVFLDETESKFASAEKLKQGFGEYSGDKPRRERKRKNPDLINTWKPKTPDESMRNAF